MKNEQSQGLGDDIAKITKLTKLDILAKKIANFFDEEDCGCKERQRLLNDLFPHRKTNQMIDSTQKNKEEE